MRRVKEAELSESGWTASRLHFILMLILEVVMLVELIVLTGAGRLLPAFVTIALMSVIAAPVIFKGRFGVPIPSELHFFAALFIFATLFLGEVQGFYHKLWWWDLALHGFSGVLLGLLGFMFVYLVNENETVDVRMKPSFVALFAFFFAVGMGTIWEIFEFSMDELFGFDMQKAMFGDPSGLTDTMWDLIVDTIGSALMAGLGWLYMRRAKRERTDHWLRRFVDRYPNLFAD